MQVDYDKYKEQNFTCSKCGWQGKGSELSHGDFSEMGFIGDLECPKCFNLVAFWQSPLIDKKKNN
jgi:ribosomal protein S27AE